MATSTRDRTLAEYRKAILKGMARTLWVHAIANWATENEDSDAQAATLIDASKEIGWSDSVTSTPDAAVDAAVSLAKLYEDAEGDLVDLYVMAVEVDTGKPYEIDVHIGRGASTPLPEEFGNALANMALGTGLSWFDDHKKFKLTKPAFECHYDGEDLTWNGRIVNRDNPSRAELRDPMYIRDSIKESLTDEFKTKVAKLELKPGPLGKNKTQEAFILDLANNLATGLVLDDDGDLETKRSAGQLAITWTQTGTTETFGDLDAARAAILERVGDIDATDSGWPDFYIANDLSDAPAEFKIEAYGRGKWYELATVRPSRSNPPGRFTAKGERMYQDVKAEYEAKGDPRAAEIAARTVYAEAKKGVDGLLNVPGGRPPGVPNPSGRFRRL